jgi:transposase-like protein
MGQLASACNIDGHNWLYPVAYGEFDWETTDNWKWFMTRLRKAIGTPSGLVISSDAGKGLGYVISSVFPNCEQRVCMRHLMENFKKKFHGEEIANHMWCASRAYTVDTCQLHLERVKKLAPTTIGYLENNHIVSKSIF